jgi:hypothetical protein
MPAVFPQVSARPSGKRLELFATLRQSSLPFSERSAPRSAPPSNACPACPGFPAASPMPLPEPSSPAPPSPPPGEPRCACRPQRRRSCPEPPRASTPMVRCRLPTFRTASTLRLHLASSPLSATPRRASALAAQGIAVKFRGSHERLRIIHFSCEPGDANSPQATSRPVATVEPDENNGLLAA